MRIVSHANIALHSPSTPGGLVYLLPGLQKEVPDDVLEHPAFEWLIGDGTVVVLVGPTETALELAMKKTSGDFIDAGDWTAAGQDESGFPVEPGSSEDVLKPSKKALKEK